MTNTKCECKDCESAVSPLAYLADLLSYAIKNLNVSLEYLTETFYQPFGDLPVSCEEMDKKVRQVRICIEVLWRYLLDKKLSDPDIAEYLREAYEILLTKLGTTYEEIRSIPHSDQETRQTIAERLGIGVEHLNELISLNNKLLDKPITLTERDLEEFFGLVDTNRNPLCDGAKFGDGSKDREQIKRWNLSGVEWNRNTDPNGRIYVSLKKLPLQEDLELNARPTRKLRGRTKSTDYFYRVHLYRDSKRSNDSLVAGGSRATEIGTIQLSEMNNSGLSGTFEIQYNADNEKIEISAIPRLLSWRLQYLRQQWSRQDWPDHPYRDLITKSGSSLKVVRERRLLIDPDIIGPDDFRSPFQTTGGESAFDLWLQRRQWVDFQVREMSQDYLEENGKKVEFMGEPIPDMKAILAHMFEEIEYPLKPSSKYSAVWGTKPKDWDIYYSELESIYKNLLKSTDQDKAIGQFEKKNLHLTEESFSRLMELWKKDRHWQKDKPWQKNQKDQPKFNRDRLTNEEWQEVYSILVQAKKESLFTTWKDEEDTWKEDTWKKGLTKDSKIHLGLGEFWFSLRSPLEGEWPPLSLEKHIKSNFNVPLIDPDNLTLKELTEPTIGSQAIKLWKRRREEIDKLPDELRKEYDLGRTHAEGLDRILQDALGQTIRKEALNEFLKILDELHKDLNIKDSNEEAKAKKLAAEELLQKTLHMSAEDFQELITIKKKAKPSPQEMNEVYKILAKSAIALRYQPQTLTSKEQNTEEQRLIKELQDRYKKEGFNAILENAFGTLTRWLNSFNQELERQEDKEKQKTIEEKNLHFTVEDLLFLIAFQSKLQPSEQSINRVCAILAQSKKFIQYYPNWYNEEVKQGFLEKDGLGKYWQALKARLPRWRASAEARQEWQQALRLCSRAPLIDPDLLKVDSSLFVEEHFASSQLGEEARELFWKTRQKTVNDEISNIKTRGLGANDQEKEFEELLFDYLLDPNITGNFSPKTKSDAVNQLVLALDEEQAKGEDISSRLEQLGLTPRAFNYLVQAQKILESSKLLEQDWQAIASILVQAKKHRCFSEWLEEERKNNLTLGPDCFTIPQPDPELFPPPDKFSQLPEWRASRSDYLDWEDRLQSRIDQHQSAIAAFFEAVSSAEEIILPTLRDVLIQATDPGADFIETAKNLTDKLLIDTQVSGCQKTTRISQAIETLQNLLWSIRTGQLYDTYPQLKLLNSDVFDEEWKWIGSYSTWRAAMFVFLYPENILIPTLRKHQTPAFRQLVHNLRAYRNLTPEKACYEAEKYSDYFKDICNLKIEASCQSYIRLRSDSCRYQSVEEKTYPYYFHFAIGGKTNSIYYLTYSFLDDIEGAIKNKKSSRQYFWKQVPTLKQNVLKIIGAHPYKISNNDRHIYLFAKVIEKGEEQLVCVKYDLETQQWIHEEPITLELPQGTNTFEAIVKQSSREQDPPHLGIQITKGVNSGGIYERKINREGSDWEEIDLSNNNNESLGNWIPLVYPILGEQLGNLRAMVEITANEFLLITQNRSLEIKFRLFGPFDIGGWEFSEALGKGKFIGAFSWPDREKIYIYLKSKSSNYFHQIGRSDNIPNFKVFPGVSSSSVWLRKNENLLGLYNWIENIVGKDIFDEADYYSAYGWSQPIKEIFRSSDYRWKEHKAWKTSSEAVDFIIEWIGEIIEKDPTWHYVNLMIKKFSEGNKSLKSILEEIVKNFHDVKFLSRESLKYENKSLILQSINIDYIAPISGPKFLQKGSPSYKHFAFQQSGDRGGVFRFSLLSSEKEFRATSYVRIIPNVSGPFDLIERPATFILRRRRKQINEQFFNNQFGLRQNQTYLEEIYYFIPVYLALQLQKHGRYISALNWFRHVYDFTIPETQGEPSRKFTYPFEKNIYYYYWKTNGEKNESKIKNHISSDYERYENWLLDPLNPHLIAENRFYTYTRFTLVAIIRCLLAYANAEFTFDTAESIARARSLYMTVLELLETKELKQQGACHELTVELIQLVKNNVPPGDAVNDFESKLGRTNNIDSINELSKKIPELMKKQKPWKEKLLEAEKLVDATLSQQQVPITFAKILEDRDRTVAKNYRDLLSNKGILAASHHIVDSATVSSDKKYSSYFSKYLSVAEVAFCISPNPVIKALKLQAEINLHKLRTCRNIAGMKRELEPYASLTDQVSGLPQIGASGQLLLPGTATIRPTPYRYPFLIERAKQLVNIAQQIEASMLAALEKLDAEAYSQLKVRQDIQLAGAQITLQSLRVKEANDSVKLAKLQEHRAKIQIDQYQAWLDEGLIGLEQASLTLMGVSVATYGFAAAAALAKIWKMEREQAFGYTAQALQTTASMLSQWASYERRAQEWQFQKTLAEQDFLIGAQQVTVAEDRVRVVGQERIIAIMQKDHAKDTAEFLINKFTNKELYDWMSDVLEGVYSYFLQEATAVAKLAENQLAFERQLTPPRYIQEDYWEPPSENMMSIFSEKATDRRGLTGSTRLLQDIYQLDQYAIETDKRKLQLSKTISLAALSPVEFQQFRETGVMTFRTLLEMFDRDFPGHYLRLIKQVRTSVLALIPPTRGIHATLSTTATSRVVIGGDIFQTVIVQRDPEYVALTSPRDATGLFELQQQSEMLLPFEGLGVDTHWEFRLPKAANQFDYSTIADVLITIDYTALNSFDYRQQVIQTLNPKLSAMRPFSFRNEFADAWYDLHNPDQTKNPMVVRFETRREDFPQNLDRLKIQHVVLYFVRKPVENFEVAVTHLHFTEQGSNAAVGGGASSIDGVISTRLGNASSWQSMMGKKLNGQWELSLQNSDPVKDRAIRSWFKDEKIEDILFVITYAGQTPDWPS